MAGQTTLIIFWAALLLILVFLLILLPLILLLRREARKRRERRLTAQIRATITQMKMEASTFGSWWVMTASCTNPHTGHLLTFHSPHLSLRPDQQVGDQILVYYDPHQPDHNRMELS